MSDAKRMYGGKETTKALANFPFSIHSASHELVCAMVLVKKAAALAHKDIGELDGDISDAIVWACDRVLSGELEHEFCTPALQGGAGTSINMNVNEVLAALATEHLSGSTKKVVHPNDHVNKSQSTNDVNPTALKIAAYSLTEQLLGNLVNVQKIFAQKAAELAHVHKLARTHLQDALPTTLGKEFEAYGAIIGRDMARIVDAQKYMLDQNLGGTAIGDQTNASAAYIDKVYMYLAKLSGIPVKSAQNMMGLTSSQSDFCHLADAVQILALDMSKIASDIRLLSSGPKGGLGELKIPEMQSGSSIMPGKVNPVLPESVNQLFFLVSGNVTTIHAAAHASQLELGVMFPILADRLIEVLILVREVLSNFASGCIMGVVAQVEVCAEHLEKSSAYATLLTPEMGYDQVSAIVKEYIETGVSIRQLVVDKGLLTTEKFDQIVQGKK